MNEHKTIRDGRPTSYRDCPKCHKKIEYWYSGGMSHHFPHFYCEKCSNVIWRESDFDLVMRNEVSNSLLEQIVKDLPSCFCGGKYQSGANPKCPFCSYEFPHQDSILERMTDPHVILFQGAVFTIVRS